jgi:hypothetical protein
LLLQQWPKYRDDVVLNGLSSQFACAHGSSQTRDCSRAPVHLYVAHIRKKIDLWVVVAKCMKGSLINMLLLQKKYRLSIAHHKSRQRVRSMADHLHNFIANAIVFDSK